MQIRRWENELSLDKNCECFSWHFSQPVIPQFCCLPLLVVLWLWFPFRSLLGDSYSSLKPWRHWGWHQRWRGEKLWHLQRQAENRRDSFRYIAYERKWQLQRWMLEWPEEATILNSKHAMSFSIFRWLDKLLHLSVSILLFVIQRMRMQKWHAKRNNRSFKDTELTSKCVMMN